MPQVEGGGEEEFLHGLNFLGDYISGDVGSCVRDQLFSFLSNQLILKKVFFAPTGNFSQMKSAFLCGFCAGL